MKQIPYSHEMNKISKDLTETATRRKRRRKSNQEVKMFHLFDKMEETEREDTCMRKFQLCRLEKCKAIFYRTTPCFLWEIPGESRNV